jgi:ABC-type dipeptide/oligopeptide/nickel transport system permease component
MGNYIIRRLLYMVVVLIAVSAITFLLMHAVPGGPFDREKPLPPEIKANIMKRYHLDEPLSVQYARYLYEVTIPHFTTKTVKPTLEEDYLVKFKVGPVWVQWMNFGPSFSSRSRTVNDIFRQQLPVSFQLGIFAVLIAVIIGMPLGVISALKHNTFLDYLGMSVAIFGVSVPSIVLAPIAVTIFGVALKWLPPTGWGSKPPYILGLIPRNLDWSYFRYAILPAIVLGLGSSAVIARLARASLLQVINEDYIRTAYAKGLRYNTIVFRHALRNALIPVITILGPMFAALVTGTFVTETIFGIPGMGKYFVTSITNRDYPVIMGTVLLYAIFLVFANLAVDLIYGYLDPRIRYD